MKGQAGNHVAAAEERRRREAQDFLAVDIAKGDNESVTLSVRASIERGYQNTFNESLREGLRKKENEIDRICARNYSEFLASMTDMLRMRGAARDLTDIVSKIHMDFNESGEEMVGVLTRLEDLQVERTKTRSVLESVIRCKELSKLMLQTKNYLDAEDHYSAMHELEVIQQKYMQNKGPSSEDSKTSSSPLPAPIQMILTDWIQKNTSALTESTMDEADALLFRLRDKSQLVGRVVLKRQASIAMLANATSLANAELMHSTDVGSSSETAVTSSPSLNPSIQEHHFADIYSEAYSKLTLLHKAPTFSLQSIKRCSASLRLGAWLESKDLEGWLSQRYTLTKSKTTKKSTKSNPAIPSPMSSPIETGGKERSFDYVHKVSDAEEKWLHDLPENIGALHKAIHVASVLQTLPQLHEHIRQDRAAALNDILNSNDEALKTCGLTDTNGIVRYVSNIAGFFMIECMMRSCVERQEGAFDWQEILDLWTKCCVRLDTAVAKGCPALRTPEQILMVKDEISLLAEVASDETLRLPASSLNETVRLLWGHFTDIQLTTVRNAVLTALTSGEAFLGMRVTDEKTLATKIMAFSLDEVQISTNTISSASKSSAISSAVEPETPDNNHRRSSIQLNLDHLESDLLDDFDSPAALAEESNEDAALRGNSYDTKKGAGYSLPADFTFSVLVPAVQRALYLTVARIVGISAKNPLLGNLGEDTCNSVKDAYEAVADTLERELRRAGTDTPLAKAVQISTDAATLAFACSYTFTLLRTSLQTLHWNRYIEEPIQGAERASRGLLMKLSLEAQDVIFELLHHKMQMLLESLIFIDTVPQELVKAPHEIVEDAIQFLGVNMQILANLPQAAKDIAQFTCCNSISHAILQHLLSDRVKTINILYLARLDQDCRHLARYALSTQVTSLNLCFAELHETVQAATNSDLHKLSTDKAHRRRVYPKLDPDKLALLLEKMHPATGVPPGSNLPNFDVASARTLAGQLRKHGSS